MIMSLNIRVLGSANKRRSLHNIIQYKHPHLVLYKKLCPIRWKLEKFLWKFVLTARGLCNLCVRPFWGIGRYVGSPFLLLHCVQIHCRDDLVGILRGITHSITHYQFIWSIYKLKRFLGLIGLLWPPVHSISYLGRGSERMGKSGGRKASSIHYQVILRIYLRIIHLRTSFLPYQSYMEEWQMWGRRHFKKVGQVFSPLTWMWKIT